MLKKHEQAEQEVMRNNRRLKSKEEKRIGQLINSTLVYYRAGKYREGLGVIERVVEFLEEDEANQYEFDMLSVIKILKVYSLLVLKLGQAEKYDSAVRCSQRAFQICRAEIGAQAPMTREMARIHGLVLLKVG